MLKTKKKISLRDVTALTFILMQVAIFPLIQFTPGNVSAEWSYVSIILCVIIAFVFFDSDRADHLIRMGLCCTLVADYFLVVDGDKLLEGVIAFTFVQTAYFAYLYLRERRRALRIANVISRTVVSLALIIGAFIVLGEDADALAIVSVIYYANLVINTVFAFTQGRRERVFAIGLLLFCMCDLCIGLEVRTARTDTYSILITPFPAGPASLTSSVSGRSASSALSRIARSRCTPKIATRSPM